jgi:anti-sigma factor RsiW
MNNHQPYLDWITSDDTLPTDCARDLREHLEHCAKCQSVAGGWESARRAIRVAGMEPPAAGFVRRWKAMAERRIQAPSMKPAWEFLAVTGLGWLGLAVGLASQVATSGFSLTGIFTRTVTTAVGAVADWSDTAEVLSMVVQAITHSAPPALWFGVIFLLSLLCIGWLIFLYRCTRQGVRL